MEILIPGEEINGFMRYQKIESQIWNDEKFSRLSASDQRLFFYILTSPHNNLIGLYVLKQGYACDDLRTSPEELRKGLESLCESGLIAYDFKNQVVWIKNFLKHNPIGNPNQKKAMLKEVDALPNTQLTREFTRYNSDFISTLDEGLRKGLERASEGLTNPLVQISISSSNNYNSEADNNSEAKIEKKRAREKTENLESLNLSQNSIPPPALVGNPFVESYSAPVWLRKVFGELYEEATGQLVICSGIEVAKAKEFFAVLSKLHPDADDREIYERAKLGTEIAFEGYTDGTGYFHWLDKSPPTVGWFANNAPQVNLAVTARLNMTEEEIEREQETREAYERIKAYADEVDAQVEKDLAEGRKPLSGGLGLPKPRTEH